MSTFSQHGPLPTTYLQSLSGLSLDLVGERRPSFFSHAALVRSLDFLLLFHAAGHHCHQVGQEGIRPYSLVNSLSYLCPTLKVKGYIQLKKCFQF